MPWKKNPPWKRIWKGMYLVLCVCSVNLQEKRKRNDLNSAEWRKYVGVKGINLTELLMNTELKVSGKRNVGEGEGEENDANHSFVCPH